MKLLVLILLCLPALLLESCKWNKDRLKIDVSTVNVPDVKIARYDKDLFKVPLNDLQHGLEKIRQQYLFFLGTDLNDTLNLASMRTYLANPRNLDFQQASIAKYPDLKKLEQDLTGVFKHMKYYFPHAKIPKVYSYISGGDYENPVRVVDSVMIIAIDCYLGKDFKPYLADGVSLYKAERMNPDNIIPDCLRNLTSTLYPVNPDSYTLLDQMVEAGKRLYMMEALNPETPPNLLIGFNPVQYDWIMKNESHVWAAIIDNRMLYASDGQTLRVFLADGPFNPAFGKDSPPRLGEWIGWRIVKSYMETNTEVSLNDLMNEKESQKILAQSQYKPEK